MPGVVSTRMPWVTVSWNKFINTDKTMLLSHDNDAALQDTGKLHVSYHHNWFNGARSTDVDLGSVVTSSMFSIPPILGPKGQPYHVFRRVSHVIPGGYDTWVCRSR